MNTTLHVLALVLQSSSAFLLGFSVRGILSQNLVVYHARKPVSLRSRAHDYDNLRRILFFIRHWGRNFRMRLEVNK
jgi:hypothetical protein